MPWIDRTKKIKQPKPKYVHHSNMSHKYYNSKQWKDMRNVYYKNHPFCLVCERKGITKIGDHVHHKTPFMSTSDEEERWNLLLDESNLETLCKKCHLEAHMKLKMMGKDWT